MTLRGEQKRFQDAVRRLRSHIDALSDYVVQDLPTTALRQSVALAAAQVNDHAAVISTLTYQENNFAQKVAALRNVFAPIASADWRRLKTTAWAANHFAVIHRVLDTVAEIVETEEPLSDNANSARTESVRYEDDVEDGSF